MANAKLVEIRENEQEILKVAERAQKYLASENKIVITHAEAIPTIAYAMARATIEMLNEMKTPGSDVEINFLGLYDMGISYRQNEDAEKEGNYTPFLRPGQEFKLLVKDDADTEE